MLSIGEFITLMPVAVFAIWLGEGLGHLICDYEYGHSYAKNFTP